MQVKILASMAGPGPLGNIVSWTPNSVVDVDDADKVAVAFYRGFVKAGIAEVIEEPKAAAKVTSPPPAAESEPPPKAGPGSSREAWADYAASQGIEVTENMSRDDIVAAVEED